MPQRANKDLVAVPSDDDPRDIIWIYAEGTEGMQKRINKRFMQMRQEVGGKLILDVHPSDYNHAILCEFIHHWEGPGVAGLKFSESALDEIKAGDPHLAKTLAEIKRLNPFYADGDTQAETEGEPSPNPPALEQSDGGESWQVVTPNPQENGTFTSALPSDTVGTPQ